MKNKVLLILIVFLFCIAWSNNPNVNTPVCTASGCQRYPQIASDGFSGAIIIWEDNRNGNRDIYAQLLDSTGKTRWAKPGVAVCTAPGTQEYPQILPDGHGGAFIAWEDNRGNNYDIFAQRIDANGTALWAVNGVPVCRAPGNQKKPLLVRDRSGGVIISWQDKRSGNYWEIYAQRVNSSGQVLWTTNGNFVYTVANTDNSPQICYGMVSDGSGGAVFAMQDRHGYGSDVYAQRINSAGILQWTAAGAPVCRADGYQGDAQLAADGAGGAVIAWVDERYLNSNGERDIYAQRINSNGSALWGADGVHVYLDWAFVYLYDLKMISDGSGGAILTWECNVIDSLFGTSDLEVYGLRIDAAGNRPWIVFLNRSSEDAERPALVSDGSGGAIFAWQDECNSPADDIYAQRVDAGGNELWGTDGVAICTKSGSQWTPQLVGDGAGGAIITWDYVDIYAQNVCDSGGLGNCNSPTAVINADRFGGIAPVTINFDGSGSFDPDGYITRWYWDFADGDTSLKEKVEHTYFNPGKYNVALRVKDNSGRWSTWAKRWVLIYSAGDIDKVLLELSDSKVKADGKGLVQVRAACYEKQTDPDHEERPIPVDLGLNFTTSSGTWQDDFSFSSGIYSRTLISGAQGTATVSAVLDGDVFNSKTVEFTWPQPPVNLKVELKENRSLLRGEYYAYLSWSANPEEVFTPAKYRIYRSTNEGSFTLAAEVGADVFTFVDASLPAGNSYSYAVTMVDTAGDESSLSSPIAAYKK